MVRVEATGAMNEGSRGGVLFKMIAIKGAAGLANL
jgi:hypothetical protein